MILINLYILLHGLFSFTDTSSIHQFQIRALNSEEVIDFKSFAGKKILVVNVASKCGFTKQYAGLETLFQKYQDQLVIIGFPCNQFLGQEPGTEAEIVEFCSANFGVSFPMTEKIDVKGENAHEIYQWLTSSELNGKEDYKISWNFNKFLLDEEGRILEHFPSKVKPLDEEILAYLE